MDHFGLTWKRLCRPQPCMNDSVFQMSEPECRTLLLHTVVGTSSGQRALRSICKTQPMSLSFAFIYWMAGALPNTFLENPPCLCRRRIYFSCMWCPDPRAQHVLCECQLQWIVRGGSDLETVGRRGCGICFLCYRFATFLIPTLTLQRLGETLDRQTAELRTAIRRSAAAATREIEVEGRFLLSTHVDDRVGISVMLDRPRGVVNATPATRGTTDQTIVQYRIDPYDVAWDRYITEGYRHFNRSFDWDEPDRYEQCDGAPHLSDSDL